MDMKNTAILLIFLLCILGLMVGAYCTDVSEGAVNLDEYDEVIHEDSNGTITINLELKEKNENILDKLYT